MEEYACRYTGRHPMVGDEVIQLRGGLHRYTGKDKVQAPTVLMTLSTQQRWNSSDVEGAEECATNCRRGDQR